MRTNQELFDTVITHLATQGKQSIESSTCRYRGPGGLKCAIGALIPDEAYRPSFDTNIAGHTTCAIQCREDIRHAADIGVDQTPLARYLQGLHDDPDSWGPGFVGWESAVEVADRFSLSPAILDRLRQPATS